VQTGLDHTLLALADPTRRAILQRLAHGEARVTEIADPFAMSLNGVSKHIRMLERADLVRRRRAGREHFLSLNPQPLDAAAKWIAAQRALWAARLDVLAELLRAEDETAATSRPRKRSPRKPKKKRSKA
jgi:DNA-binding transcriptional ArsR family regulator